MSINWAQLVLSETFFQRITRLVQRSIVDACVAEEAVTYIIQRLSENNWEKCQGYTGKSTPETFLYSVSSNLIIDYSRKVYGRQRPPAWLQRKGPLWLSIWKELCLDRHSADAVISRHDQDATRDTAMLEQIVRVIKARLPWCGVSTRPESLDEKENQVLDTLSAQHRDTDACQKAAFEQALEFAHLLLKGSGEYACTSELITAEPETIYDVLRSIMLTPEEKLVLKMHFCDGMSFSAIARALDMAKHQPVRLINKTLERVKQQLVNYGIDLEPVNAV